MAIELWDSFKRFGLPFDPCWGRNPAWIIDAINICDKVFAEYRKDKDNGCH